VTFWPGEKSTQDTTQDTTQVSLTEQDISLLRQIRSNPSMTQKQIAEQLGWSVDRVKYYFNKLKTNGLIKRVGSSQTGHWELLVEEQEEANTWFIKPDYQS